MLHNVNTEIAVTHIMTNKRHTIVVALGVTIGIAMFIFMNALMKGFNRYSESSIFKTVPHIRIYKEDEISLPLQTAEPGAPVPLLLNPSITTLTRSLYNPEELIRLLEKQADVVAVAPEVIANVFYSVGSSTIPGTISGVDITAENTMFNIGSTMVDGNVESLQGRQDGIIIGQGIASKLSVRLEDNISVTSAEGVIRVFKVTGIFRSGSTAADRTRSYINLSAAQQLIRQGPGYVTDIYVNIKDPYDAPRRAPFFEALTHYKAEDWQTANAAITSANKVRQVVGLSISLTVLLVAGFGIYNILNMTIQQKMNDIAILKATGFSGKDVTNIFLKEALAVGCIGVCAGVLLSVVIIRLLARIYLGGEISYFPIRIEPWITIQGVLFAMAVTLIAGYIPSRKAAGVDPVQIFRK